MAKNPLLQQKFDDGRQLGRQEGIEQATDFFVAKFRALEKMDGVGPKTLEKVKQALGEQYFS